MNNPIARVHKHTLFENKMTFRRLWAKEPGHSDFFLTEMCHLYRRTRLSSRTPRYGNDHSLLLLAPAPRTKHFRYCLGFTVRYKMHKMRHTVKYTRHAAYGTPEICTVGYPPFDLTRLGLQPRFGDDLPGIRVVSPQNGTAVVLQGLSHSLQKADC